MPQQLILCIFCFLLKYLYINITCDVRSLMMAYMAYICHQVIVPYSLSKEGCEYMNICIHKGKQWLREIER